MSLKMEQQLLPPRSCTQITVAPCIYTTVHTHAHASFLRCAKYIPNYLGPSCCRTKDHEIGPRLSVQGRTHSPHGLAYTHWHASATLKRIGDEGGTVWEHGRTCYMSRECTHTSGTRRDGGIMPTCECMHPYMHVCPYPKAHIYP